MQQKKAIFSLVVLIMIIQLKLTLATSSHRRYENYPCYHKHGVRVPKPGSCSEYYVCVNSNAIVSSCSGSYHFDEITKRCLHPDYAECQQDEDNYPTILSTNAPEAIVVSPLSFPAHLPKPHHPDEVVPDETAGNICLREINGALVPKLDSCSQYYICLLQRPYRRTCPVLLHFNAKLQLCQDPVLAQCMPPSTQSPVALELATFDIDSATCKGIPDGMLLPHIDSCNKFFNCRNQERIEMNCPEGLHFNVRHQNCDWPNVAKCNL